MAIDNLVKGGHQCLVILAQGTVVVVAGNSCAGLQSQHQHHDQHQQIMQILLHLVFNVFMVNVMVL